ncbi:MAG TPA: hypothetical protein VL027_07415 [Spongiibacteraceae bacterium]|nr:hypothetical protein [Spongiibacteraceae bacterium]
MSDHSDPNRSGDAALQDALLQGKAWQDFCEALKKAGERVQTVESRNRDLDVSEGYRYLTRLMRMGFEMILEYGDPAAPALLYQNPTLKSGGDNPDNMYYWGRIRGRYNYRLEIQLQPNVDLSICVYAGGLNKGGGRRTVSELRLKDIKPDQNGRVSITLSQQRQPGYWMALSEDASTVLIRETVGDRRNARPSTFVLHNDSGGKPQPMTPLHLAKVLRSVAGFVTYSINFFVDMVETWRRQPNRFFESDSATANSTFGDSRYQYPSCYFQLEDGEALLVAFTAPADCFWSVVLSNHWFESLDYLHYDIHVNPLLASFAPGEPVRIVVASQDPGWPGWYWLDTTGHSQGIVNVRFVDAPPQPLPGTRVVALAAGPPDAAP